MDNPFKGLSKGGKIAVAAGGVIVVYFVWKQHSAGSGVTTSTAASGSAIDPVTGLPVSQDSVTDPLTGQAYLAEAQQYGSVQAAEQALSGSTAGYGVTSSYGYGGYGAAAPLVPANVVQGADYASNSAWAQAAQSGLTDVGYSPTDISAALGAYLSNQAVTSAQASIIQAAIAEYGPPPVGSYTVHLASPPQSSGSGSPGISVPDVEGLDAAQAIQVLSSAGFRAHAPAAVKGVTHVVDGQTPKGGTKEPMGTAVYLTVKTAGTPPHAAPSGVTVPDVVGQEQSRAYGVLSHDGFRPQGPAPVHGKVHTVTAQHPAAGTRAPRGSVVTLTSKLS